MHFKHLLFISALLLSTLPIFALETTAVELREGEENDSTVRITRSGNQLIFQDQIAGSVSLSDINQIPTNHSVLQNLSADDHPQYLTPSRHTSAHSSGFNGALAIPTDSGGNSTLGSHVLDATIHLDSQANSSVVGRWEFLNSLIVRKSPILFQDFSQANKLLLTFSTNQGDADFAYSVPNQRFEVDSFHAESLAGTTASVDELSVNNLLGYSGNIPSGTLSGFETIEGIPAQNLLDSAAEEDVTGAWDFLNQVDVIVSNFSTVFNEQGLEVRYMPFIESLTEAADNRTRSALKAQIYLDVLSNVSMNDTVAFAVEGDASVETAVNGIANGLTVGVGGIASTKQAQFDAIGVVGVTRFALESASKRVGVLGAENDDIFSMRELLPEGNHAGVFLGDVYITEGVRAAEVNASLYRLGPYATGSAFTAGSAMEWSSSGTLIVAGNQTIAKSYAGVSAGAGASGTACTLIAQGVITMPADVAINSGDRLSWDGTYVTPYQPGDKRTIGNALETFDGTGTTQLLVQVQPMFHP